MGGRDDLARYPQHHARRRAVALQQHDSGVGGGEKGIFWAAHQCDRAYCQIERLAGLDALPLRGFEVFAFPLKVVGGSAGPARVVAIEPG